MPRRIDCEESSPGVGRQRTGAAAHQGAQIRILLASKNSKRDASYPVSAERWSPSSFLAT